MALKKVSIEQVKLEKVGDKTAGYLLEVSLAELPDMNDPAKKNSVPKVKLQAEDGGRFTVLMGSNAMEVIHDLVPGLWTQVERGKEVITRRKMRMTDWLISQDADKVLRAPTAVKQ